MSSDEDFPAQQESLRAALVEAFQAVAELSVTEDEEDVSAQQELPHPALVEDVQAAEELSVTEDEEDVPAQQELPHPALVEDFQAAAELSVTEDEDVSVVKFFNFAYPLIIFCFLDVLRRGYSSSAGAPLRRAC